MVVEESAILTWTLEMILDRLVLFLEFKNMPEERNNTKVKKLKATDVWRKFRMNDAPSSSHIYIVSYYTSHPCHFRDPLPCHVGIGIPGAWSRPNLTKEKAQVSNLQRWCRIRLARISGHVQIAQLHAGGISLGAFTAGSFASLSQHCV
jgi:hypothetical protein